MKIVVLASGSNGNCTYFETKKHKVLIDCGITFKNIYGRLNELGYDFSQIDTLLITHEHSDHVRGLRVLAKKIPLNIYLTQGTYDGLDFETKQVLEVQNVKIIKGNDVLKFADFEVNVLNLHHDARETVGYVIKEDGKKFVYITDTGYVEKGYYSLISNAGVYVMESNYDVELLWSSNRPFELKKRIGGDYGHMSNEESAVLLSKVVGLNTHDVILAHISNDCNYYHLPDLIKKTHFEVYEEFGLDTTNITFTCGNREGVTGEFLL